MAEPVASAEHFELTIPVPTAVPGKKEVVELFWYGCPHTYRFEAVVNPWAESLPEDTVFRKVPAMFGGPWDAHGQMFLALEAMGADPKVHAAVFDAIQKQRMRLTGAQEQAGLLATQGVDKDKYQATFHSFAVKGQVQKARRLTQKYEATGVPSLIVNGRHRSDLAAAGGPEALLDVVDSLLARP
ncbi:thiol:disulfide interchange protein DsbA/DsbL [Streptomyces sp. AK02-04a]|uniref:thiol:disulfide interchange protein DsbA/DsbL n=1 Tax=Streptomyces sp. AK02-04a TaxID=3028649 RepID=UPI0029B106A4|nr:thiol:disulfide interchange protein DsbA/DsbL [Streptomyces sp. AK02-04a]MDX3763879.1 thiol:disulfide interchange protein DsbA/DsbL [Streptomyces sp. AK02-04a]